MSKGPKERLIEAKELFDMGILSEEEYAQIKSDCIAQMKGIITNPPSSSVSPGTIVNTTPPPSEPSSLGTYVGLTSVMVIGDYEVIERIGEGGMGSICSRPQRRAGEHT